MLRQSRSWVFMGVIQHGRLSPDPAKIQAVTKWLVPTTRRQLQQVLGFANFYRRVIRNYTTEQNYDVGNRKLLALVLALQNW